MIITYSTATQPAPPATGAEPAAPAAAGAGASGPALFARMLGLADAVVPDDLIAAPPADAHAPAAALPAMSLPSMTPPPAPPGEPALAAPLPAAGAAVADTARISPPAMLAGNARAITDQSALQTQQAMPLPHPAQRRRDAIAAPLSQAVVTPPQTDAPATANPLDVPAPAAMEAPALPASPSAQLAPPPATASAAPEQPGGRADDLADARQQATAPAGQRALPRIGHPPAPPAANWQQPATAPDSLAATTSTMPRTAADASAPAAPAVPAAQPDQFAQADQTTADSKPVPPAPTSAFMMNNAAAYLAAAPAPVPAAQPAANGNDGAQADALNYTVPLASGNWGAGAAAAAAPAPENLTDRAPRDAAPLMAMRHRNGQATVAPGEAPALSAAWPGAQARQADAGLSLDRAAQAPAAAQSPAAAATVGAAQAMAGAPSGADASPQQRSAAMPSAQTQRPAVLSEHASAGTTDAASATPAPASASRPAVSANDATPAAGTAAGSTATPTLPRAAKPGANTPMRAPGAVTRQADASAPPAAASAGTAGAGARPAPVAPTPVAPTPVAPTPVAGKPSQTMAASRDDNIRAAGQGQASLGNSATVGARPAPTAPAPVAPAPVAGKPSQTEAASRDDNIPAAGQGQARLGNPATSGAVPGRAGAAQAPRATAGELTARAATPAAATARSGSAANPGQDQVRASAPSTGLPGQGNKIQAPLAATERAPTGPTARTAAVALPPGARPAANTTVATRGQMQPADSSTATAMSSQADAMQPPLVTAGRAMNAEPATRDAAGAARNDGATVSGQSLAPRGNIAASINMSGQTDAAAQPVAAPERATSTGPVAQATTAAPGNPVPPARATRDEHAALAGQSPARRENAAAPPPVPGQTNMIAPPLAATGNTPAAGARPPAAAQARAGTADAAMATPRDAATLEAPAPQANGAQDDSALPPMQDEQPDAHPGNTARQSAAQPRQAAPAAASLPVPADRPGMAAAAVTPRNQTRVPDSGRANTAASVPRQAGAAQLPPLEDTGATLAAPRTAAASRNHPVQANDADRDLPRVADATGAAAAESRADAAPAPQAAQPNPATTIVAPDVAPVLQRPANAVNDPARHSSTAPAPAGLANAAASRPAEAPASPEPSRLADAATPAAPGRSNGAAPAQERFSTLLAAGAERSDAAASWNINLPAAAADSGADTVRLTGQSTQWQQPLREALGERLQVQLGRNAEHAVIRLDPPMLGRIEISIRHSAGTLQVHLAASNSEVLQQLHAIGDGMRQDLSQRQYSDVSVNIAPTPRSPAAQAFSQGDADGRQRQSGRDQDEDAPNRALSEAGQPSSTFALNGLE